MPDHPVPQGDDIILPDGTKVGSWNGANNWGFEPFVKLLNLNLDGRLSLIHI